MQNLQNTVDQIGKKINLLENRFSYANNLDGIKYVWNCFFDQIDKVDTAIRFDELTLSELIEICNSFQRKFDIIKNYANAEIKEREGKYVE